MTENLPRKVRAHLDPAFDRPQERGDTGNIAVRQRGTDAVFFDPDNEDAYIKTEATVDVGVMQ